MMLFTLAQLALAAGPPEVRTVPFVARPQGRCPAVVATGRPCLDRVDLLDLDRAWGARAERDRDAPTWRTISTLYARTWEDLARRWSLPDVERPMSALGFTELPATASAWQQSDAAKGAFALPRRATILAVGDWFDPVVAPHGPRSDAVLFDHVRFHGPEGQESIPRTLRLSGRFAARLGFDGRAHDYDLMDADPRSSGPFFEQLFPYQRKLSATREAEDSVYAAMERVPLTDFRFPRHLVDSTEDPFAAIRAFNMAFAATTTDGGHAGAARIASAQFQRFVRVVSVAAAQYAMADITRNQMRVLTALSAMNAPPDDAASTGRAARDLGAAARGETDTSEELLERFDTTPTARRTDSRHIRYERLPRSVVQPWVDRLRQDQELDQHFYAGLNEDVSEVFPAILRPGRPQLTALDALTRRDWLRDSVLPGNDREEVDSELLRIALRRMIDALDDEQRDRIETWMLVDQALEAMADTFDPGQPSTPDEIVSAATTQWQLVLALHDHKTEQLPQGLGAVDPTAVCSTSDGLEGLDEPSFRRVTIDQLVPGRPKANADDLLTAAAPDLPFTMVDDPDATTPTVTPLFDLGDGRVLYRVRWSVWSGWHLLWDEVAAGTDATRLVARTAAVCDDLVLASPDLTPTLIRAGLLVANVRSTVPVARSRKVTVEEPTVDGVADSLTGAPDAAAEGLAELEDARDSLDVSELEGLAGKKPTVAPSEYELELEDLQPEVATLRELIWSPLRQRLPAGGSLLFVADVGEPGAAHAKGNSPRTPYETTTGHVPGDGRFTSSAWMWLVRPDDRPLPIAPAFSPTDIDSDRPPRWARRNSADWTLTLGTGLTPWRQTRYSCLAPQPGVASNCSEPGRLLTEAVSVDLQALGTFWRHGRRVTGLDAGLEARLDVRHGGSSWFWADQNPIDLAFALRPAAGLVIGLRSAPTPGPLDRRRRGRSTWGTPRSDGPTRLGRTQRGLRASILVGPGFNGPQATVGGEAWLGWSRRRRQGKRSSLTPYHPGFLAGPFVRLQLGLPLTDGSEADRFLKLERSTSVVVGLRTHLRLARQPPPPPEIPE